MVGVSIRLGHQVLGYLRSTQEFLFTKHLLVTNTCITLCLSGTGDLMQQKYERLCKRQTSWDKIRTRNICATATVIGPACHYWYLFLDRILPGRAMRTIMKKILIDQIIFTPFNISAFLVLMGMLEGSTSQTIKAELKHDGLDLLKAEFIIWPPAQLANFYFLPTKYRVLFDNTVSLGFDYYYSYVKFRKDKPHLEGLKSTEESQKITELSSEKTDEHWEVVSRKDDEMLYEKMPKIMVHCNRAFRFVS